MFYFWFEPTSGMVTLEYGQQLFEFTDVIKLSDNIDTFIHTRAFRTSITQLRELALDNSNSKDGTIKTVSPNMFAALDFLVNVPNVEYQRIEDYCGGDEPFEIVAVEAPIEGIPTRFEPLAANQYHFLEIQGLVAHIQTIEIENQSLTITITHVDLPGY